MFHSDKDFDSEKTEQWRMEWKIINLMTEGRDALIIFGLPLCPFMNHLLFF